MLLTYPCNTFSKPSELKYCMTRYVLLRWESLSGVRSFGEGDILPLAVYGDTSRFTCRCLVLACFRPTMSSVARSGGPSDECWGSMKILALEIG